MKILPGFFLLIALVFCTCGSKKENGGADVDYQTKVRIRQYVSEGRQLYKANCANCHQEEGEGFAALYPPVKNSDFFRSDIPRSVCNMKHGLEGEIVVNGKVFNQKMPANESLTELELAEITTFLLNEFNDSIAIVTQHDVRKYLENCGNNSEVESQQR